MSEIDLAFYDPMDPVVQQDPFHHYAALRRDAPVFRHPKTGMYFVSRHETVRRVLADTDTFSSRMASAGTQPRSKSLREELRRIMQGVPPPVDTLLTADPPIQTRFRKATGRTISPQRIRGFAPAIREIARELLDAWPPGGRVDFMNSFAVPLPVRVIAHVLGMKPGLEADIKRWSDDAVAAIGAALSDERRLEAARGVAEAQRMWLDEIEERRTRPRDDILSELVGVVIEDETGVMRPITTSEVISILQQLMVAGNETTTKLLNEIVRLLAEQPDEWRRLRDDRQRIAAVVEEGLRLSSPNQGLFRQVRVDTELEGVAIAAGSTLWVMFGSANRDERVFPDPDRFDPDRKNLREHLAFGHGAHFCIGAPLARTETQIALEELADRVETLRIAPGTELRYEPSFILRGLAALEIEIKASHRQANVTQA